MLSVISGQIGSSGDMGGGMCQIPAAHWEPASQPVDPQDVQLLLYGGANSEAEEQVRKSNDKLDMLLQSTVKKTQQSAVGKENQVSEQGKLYACSHLPLWHEMQVLCCDTAELLRQGDSLTSSEGVYVPFWHCADSYSLEVLKLHLDQPIAHCRVILVSAALAIFRLQADVG